MTLMVFIMMLPVIGLGLFYVWPLSAALPTYVTLLAFSGFFHALMMRSKRVSVVTGPEALVGIPVTALSWNGRSGQVRVHDEIWQARSRNEVAVKRDDVLNVVDVEGLTLVVEPRQDDEVDFNPAL